MLGQDSEIAKSLERGNDIPFGLRLQPDDPASREVMSYNKKTKNLLLMVTVPRRTGRKRKRNSNDPFTSDSTALPARKDVKYFLRSMNDNPRSHETEIVGHIHSTHVWRNMPDFVYSAKGSMFLDEVRTKILPQEYPRLKQWTLPRAPATATADTEAIPPPAFSTQSLPQSYIYRQNPTSRSVAAKPVSRGAETATEAHQPLAEKSQLNEEEQSGRPPSTTAVQPPSMHNHSHQAQIPPPDQGSVGRLGENDA